MPAIIVGTAAIATHAEIRRMSVFCCTETLARWADEHVGEQPVVGLDVVVDGRRWSATSRKNGSISLGEAAAPLRSMNCVSGVGQRLAGPAELEHLALEAVDRVGVAAGVGGEHLLLDLLEVRRTSRSTTR